MLPAFEYIKVVLESPFLEDFNKAEVLILPAV